MSKHFLKNLDTYEDVTIVQTLPSGLNIVDHYERAEDGKWWQTYETDSTLPFCARFGDFRKCQTCPYCSDNIEEFDDIFSRNSTCQKAKDFYSADVVYRRAKIAFNEGCKVRII